MVYSLFDFGWAQLVSQVCDFCSHWVPAWEILMLGWMLCCPQQKTHHHFCARAFCVHFVLGLANSVVCPTFMHYNTKKNQNNYYVSLENLEQIS